MASDLAWAMPETSGICRREQKGIPGKENSPCKGLEIRVYDAFVCVSPTLWDPMDCSPPGSSVRGIRQARLLQWVFPSPGESSRPRD